MTKKIIFISLILLICNTYTFTQNAISFSELLILINKIPIEERASKIEQFIEQNDRTPIVENDSVIFLAKGILNTAPLLLADFNGFLNPRYVRDKSIGEMQQISGTNWYFRKIGLRMDAAINYQFQFGDKKINDPLNPDMMIAFGSLLSHVSMPGHSISEETTLDYSIPRGTLVRDSFYSEIMGHTRTVNYYLPVGYDKTKNKWPLVFFHDGTFTLKEGLASRILDRLIATEQIKPVVAVFDDPVVRGREYLGDEDYLQYLKEELIPYVEGRYHISENATDRAVIGWSRGGMSSLIVSYKLPLFGKCGIFSPAIHPTIMTDFISEIEDAGHAPSQIFMTGSLYDHIWYNDAVLLKDYFQKSELGFDYMEISAGHNIPSWRTMLDEMLIAFFSK